MSTGNKPLLAYFGIRGLGQSIRLLFEYSQIPYEYKVYPNRDEWNKDKFTIGLDLPNLPYLRDGDVQICQSMAILRYLGRKHGLMPTDEANLIRVDMIEREVDDIKAQFGKLCYSAEDFEGDKQKYQAGFFDMELKKLSDFLAKGEDRLYFGGKISYVDFWAYEVLDINVVLLGEDALDKYPNLKKFHANIANLPNIKSFLTSDRFKVRPINGATAKNFK